MGLLHSSGKVLGTGWIPSSRKASTGTLAARLGGRLLGTPSPGGVDYRNILTIRNQVETESCVGWSLGQSIRGRRIMQAHLAGLALPLTSMRFPSPFAIYTPARAIARGGSSEPLTDTGCEPALGYQAIRALGVCPEDVWPFDPAHVNDEPDMEAVTAASAQVVTGFYEADSSDLTALDLLFRHALDAGCFPTFGQQVGKLFSEYTGGIIGLLPDGTSGHMLGLAGYYPELATGRTVFYVYNHWDVTWGESGYVRVYKEFFAGSDDVGVIETV